MTPEIAVGLIGMGGALGGARVFLHPRVSWAGRLLLKRSCTARFSKAAGRKSEVWWARSD